MSRIPPCPQCSRPGIRNEQFDAYGCHECGVWIETKCSDAECEFCLARPAVPPGSVTRFRGVVVDST